MTKSLLYRRAAWLLALVLALSLGACSDSRNELSSSLDDAWWQAASPAEGGEVGIKRSPSDARTYRYVTLDNGLRVLVISDPDADKAAAALNVNVGSFQNPDDRDGLAHFLEHMLFLGTDTFPEADAYQKFISEHGGQHNAYTSLEDTNYFFDVDATHLFAALDRFSRFFVAPLFDEAYVERERNAVESEFRLKIKDDSRREWEVFGEQLDPAHPLARFSVGDLQTLADRDNDLVRDDLLEFYKQYYSADRMVLAVLGKESLDELEGAVRERFAAVPRTDVVAGQDNERDLRQEARSSKLPFKSALRLPFELHIQPVQEKHSLSVVFPVASVEPYWRTKPATYWGHLLGDESEGSLLAHLKQAGLAEGLGAGLAFDTQQGTVFALTIDLTPMGVKQKEQVLDRLFAWLNLARQQGVEKWRFDELANLQHTKFRFAEKYDPATYVQQLSAGLRHYPPEEVLRGGYLLSEFDKQVLTDFMGQLTAANAVITLVAPGTDLADKQSGINPATQISARYEAPYHVVALADSTRDRWLKAKDKTLSLAPPNPYLARTYPVSDKGGPNISPIRLENKSGAVVWHYTDQQFGSPRSVFEAELATPALRSCRNAAEADLYVEIVKNALDTKTYQARLAGLNYSLFRWRNGLKLGITGYTERQSVLLQQVLSAMASPRWDEAVFDRLKATLIREWRNSSKQWPIQQLFGELQPLVKGECNDRVLADGLADVTLEDIRNFHRELYSVGHAEFYAGGVLNAEQVRDMVSATMTTLKLGISGDAALFEAIAKLPEQAITHGLAVDHDDRSVLLYVQGDEDTLTERAQMAVINAIVEAPFYTDMRTEKQLGYAVGARLMHMNRVPGIVFFIQSPQSSVSDLKQEISNFLVSFEQTPDTLSDADLTRFKSALLANIEEKPKNLAEQVGRHQESTYLGYDNFEFRDQLAEQIKAITPASLLAAYQRLFIDGSRQLWLVTRQQDAVESKSAGESLLGGGDGVYAYPE
tara:strand:+ start:4642 stop:7611 length:2970 start_codon:yes stop_codon:yes gene_type:complete